MFKRTRDRVEIIRGNLSAARAGYRYAQSLPATEVPSSRGAPGVLERWFDDHNEGPGVHKVRHYFPLYERHLARFVGTDAHMVEIGVQSGGSLAMWRHYLGADAAIYGVDIDDACRVHETDGVRIIVGDQGDPAFWERFLAQVPRVDIVLDDGGHKSHQQIATLKALLPHISPGGVYICEDIVEAFQPFQAFIDGLTRPLSQIATTALNASPIHSQIASVHHYPMMTVIEKPAHRIAIESVKRGTEWLPVRTTPLAV